MDRNFINPKLSSKTLDRFFIRTKIYEFITRCLPLLNGNLLDVGCGKMPYRDYILKNSSLKKYIGLDIESAIEYDANIKADIKWDGQKMPIQDGEYTSVMATEVLEHCPDPNLILTEIYRIMKHNGIFIFTVPFLWNLHETPHDEYRYTPYALNRLLNDAGFKDITLVPTGGWHSSMAQMLGLWVCRSPLPFSIRRILKILILPIYRFLLKKDKHLTTFSEGLMITGICGIAYKK